MGPAATMFVTVQQGLTRLLPAGRRCQAAVRRNGSGCGL